MRVYNAEDQKEQAVTAVSTKTRKELVPYVDELEDGVLVVRNVDRAEPDTADLLQRLGAAYSDRHGAWLYEYDTVDGATEFFRRLEGKVAVRDQFMGALGEWRGDVIRLVGCREKLPNGEEWDSEVYARVPLSIGVARRTPS